MDGHYIDLAIGAPVGFAAWLAGVHWPLCFAICFLTALGVNLGNYIDDSRGPF